MIIYLKDKHSLIVDDFNFKCCVGKNGIRKRKKEGDKKTPTGLYNIGNLYFRKDRNPKINTKLKCIPIRKDMGWCNDPKNKKYLTFY